MMNNSQKTLHIVLFSYFDREGIFDLSETLRQKDFQVYFVSLKDELILDAAKHKFKPDYYLSLLPHAVQNLYIASQKYNNLTALLEPRLHALIRNTLNEGGQVFAPQHLIEQLWQLPLLEEKLTITNSCNQLKSVLVDLHDRTEVAHLIN